MSSASIVFYFVRSLILKPIIFNEFINLGVKRPDQTSSGTVFALERRLR